MALIARVRTTHTLPDGGGGLTTHYFAHNAENDPVQPYLNAVKEFWTDLQPVRSGFNAATVQGGVDILVDTTGELTASRNGEGGTLPGFSEVEVLPAASMGLISMSTDGVVAGRRVAGRLFIPAPTEAWSNGRPSAGYVTALNDAGSALMATVGADWVVWSRPVKTGAGARAGSSHSVKTAIGRGYWAVLTSRRITA